MRPSFDSVLGFLAGPALNYSTISMEVTVPPRRRRSRAPGRGSPREGVPSPGNDEDRRRGGGCGQEPGSPRRPSFARSLPCAPGLPRAQAEHSPPAGEHCESSGEHWPPAGEHPRRTGGHSPGRAEHSQEPGEHWPPAGEHSRPSGEHSPRRAERSRGTGEPSPPLGDHSPPTAIIPGQRRRPRLPPGMIAVRRRMLAGSPGRLPGDLERFPNARERSRAGRSVLGNARRRARLFGKNARRCS